MPYDRNASAVTSPDWSLQVQKTVEFGENNEGLVAADATYTTTLTGADNDLVYTADQDVTGYAGNDITITYVDPGANDAALEVVVTGTDIVVNLATGVAGAITTTADDIKTALALTDAADLVSVADSGADDGSGVVTALTIHSLAGGGDGFTTLFNVTGTVLLRVLAKCTEDLTGATATVEVGTSLLTNGLIVQTTATNIDANEIWHDATPDSSLEATSVLVQKIVSDNVRVTVGTADVTAGIIEFTALWFPLTPDSKVTAA
jgi:hypothetical protein